MTVYNHTHGQESVDVIDTMYYSPGFLAAFFAGDLFAAGIVRRLDNS